MLPLVYFLLSFLGVGKEYAIVLFNLDLVTRCRLNTMTQSLMLPEHDSFSHKKSIILQYSLAAHKMPQQLHSHASLGLIYFKMLLFLCSVRNGDIRKEELVEPNTSLLTEKKY